MKLHKLAALSALTLGVVGVAQAQDPTGVTFTEVLDVTTSLGSDSVFSCDYNPAEDVFISGTAAALSVVNGSTGADTGNDLDLGSLTPGGLGFFGVTCSEDGQIFAFEDGSTSITKWANTSAAPVTVVASGAAFARTGAAIGTGNDVTVYFTGSANNGPVEAYTTTDGSTFTLADTLEVGAKSGFAINEAQDTCWSVGDVNAPITKWVDGGSGFAQETTTWAPTDGLGGAMMDYDENNNVLIVHSVTGTAADTTYALHGDTGATLGSNTVDNPALGTTGYAGAHVDSVAASGTAWMGGRSGTAGSAVYYKYTYTVDGVAADVNEWSAYKY